MVCTSANAKGMHRTLDSLLSMYGSAAAHDEYAIGGAGGSDRRGSSDAAGSASSAPHSPPDAPGPSMPKISCISLKAVAVLIVRSSSVVFAAGAVGFAVLSTVTC